MFETMPGLKNPETGDDQFRRWDPNLAPPPEKLRVRFRNYDNLAHLPNPLLTAGSIASSRLAWLSFQSDRVGHNQVGSEFACDGLAGTQPLLAGPIKRSIHQHDKKH